MARIQKKILEAVPVTVKHPPSIPYEILYTALILSAAIFGLSEDLETVYCRTWLMPEELFIMQGNRCAPKFGQRVKV
jgi:hypothetical protein